MQLRIWQSLAIGKNQYKHKIKQAYHLDGYCYTVYGCQVSSERVEELQKQIAIICEMFHTSSLLHDDVIDHAETRRGKVSVNTKWTQARASNECSRKFHNHGVGPC